MFIKYNQVYSYISSFFSIHIKIAIKVGTGYVSYIKLCKAYKVYYTYTKYGMIVHGPGACLSGLLTLADWRLSVRAVTIGVDSK